MVHKNSSWLPGIDPRTSVPVYEQIVEQVALAIASSTLSADNPLPSVRRLASELRINPNTAARALREMEHAGLSRPLKGIGCVVAEGAETSAKQIARRALERELSGVLTVARRLGLELEEIQRAIATRWKECVDAD